MKNERLSKHSNFPRERTSQSASITSDVLNCSEFEKTGRCENMNRCSYYHEGVDCIRWYKYSSCQYGARCKYKHRPVDIQQLLRERANSKVQNKSSNEGERRVNEVNSEDSRSSDSKREDSKSRDERRSNSRSRYDDKSFSSKTSSIHSDFRNTRTEMNDREYQRSSDSAREPTREDKSRPEDSNRNDTKYNRDKSQERFPSKSSARRPDSKERLSSTSYDKKSIPDYRTKENEPRDARSSSYDRDKRKESSKDISDARTKDEKVDKDKEREKERGSVSSTSEQSLPPNWKVCFSSRGEKYYYNHVTGESTWNYPSSQKAEERPDTHSRDTGKERDSGRERSRVTSREPKEKERSRLEDRTRVDKERERERMRRDPHWREPPPSYLPPSYDWGDWRGYRDVDPYRLPYEYPPYHYDPYYKPAPGPGRYYDYPPGLKKEDKHRDDRKRKREEDMAVDKKRKKYESTIDRKMGKERRESEKSREGNKAEYSEHSGQATPLIDQAQEKSAEGPTAMEAETAVESEQPSPEQSPRMGRYIHAAKKTSILIPLEHISAKFAGKLLYSLAAREKSQSEEISHENGEQPLVDFCLSCRSNIGPKNFAPILGGSYASCRACSKQKESEIYKTRLELLLS